jgi:hypothetical protein
VVETFDLYPGAWSSIAPTPTARRDIFGGAAAQIA